MDVVQVKEENHNGRLVYIPDCPLSRVLGEATYRGTISVRLIKILRKEGFKVMAKKSKENSITSSN